MVRRRRKASRRFPPSRFSTRCKRFPRIFRVGCVQARQSVADGHGRGAAAGYGGASERIRAQLFSNSSGPERLTVAVRPEGVNSDGTVELDGGLALGLGRGSELEKWESLLESRRCASASRNWKDSPSPRRNCPPGRCEPDSAGRFVRTDCVDRAGKQPLAVWMPPARCSRAALLQVTAEAGKLRRETM